MKTFVNGADAYQWGWDACGLPKADIVEAEAHFLAESGNGWWSYWLEGWMDRTRGKEYMHRPNCIDHCQDCQDDKYAGDDWT